jgi:hypothetical protein
MKFLPNGLPRTICERRRETPGRCLSTTKWGKRIDALGYTLFGGSIDSFGRAWRYRTFPQGSGTFPQGSGTINQFHSLDDLVAWVQNVEKIRRMMAEVVEMKEPFGTFVPLDK